MRWCSRWPSPDAISILTIVSGKSKLPGPFAIGHEAAGKVIDVGDEMPDCVAHVAAGHYHPEHVVTQRVRFEDAHEAIGDPTIRVAFVRDGIA